MRDRDLACKRQRPLGDRLQPSEEGVLDDLADHVSNADVHFLNPSRVL